MPNLNLLQGKPFQKEVEPEEVESVSFEAFEQEPPPAPEPETVPEPKETAPESPKVEEVSYTRFGESRSSWPIFAAVAGALIILAVLWWAYRGFKGGGKEVTAPPDTSKVAAAQPAQEAATSPAPSGTTSETPPASAPAPTKPAKEAAPPPATPKTSPAPAIKAPALAQQRQTGAVAISLLGDFLDALPPSMIISFLSFDGKTVRAELGARDPAAFDQFAQKLRQLQSGFTLKSTYEHEEPVNGQVFTFRQVQGRVPAVSSSLQAASMLPGNAIRSRLTRLARKHGLSVRQLSVSPAAQLGGHTFRPVTAKFAGTQADVKSFLSDLLRTYRNVGVNNLVITQIVPSAAPQARVNVVLDLDVFLD